MLRHRKVSAATFLSPRKARDWYPAILIPWRLRARERERPLTSTLVFTVYRVIFQASRNHLRVYLARCGMYSANQNLRIRFRCGDRCGAHILYTSWFIHFSKVAPLFLSFSLSVVLYLVPREIISRWSFRSNDRTRDVYNADRWFVLSSAIFYPAIFLVQFFYSLYINEQH